MLDGYHILTLTHRHASIDAIRHAVVPDEEPSEVLRQIKEYFGWSELMYVATCNRVFYLFYQTGMTPEGLGESVLRFVQPELPEREIRATADSMRLYHGAEAVRHLMEVASSMDSLVVGEREIIRQLREAYDRNRIWGLPGDHIRLLMKHTIETAKSVYANTGIGEKALSIVALAFRSLTAEHVPLDARILMIGAGETNQLVTKFLHKYGYRNAVVFNRSIEKAQHLADQLGGRALPLSELAVYRGGFDVMIVCTGATQPIVTPTLYTHLLQGEQTPKVIVDLAVPNNVHENIPQQFPVRYIAIEGLRSQAEQNLAHRERECHRAAVIINERILDFRDVWHERQVERAFAHIPQEVRAAKERALFQVFDKELADLDAPAYDLVLRMMDYMEKKCIAIPIKAAKAIALRGKAATTPTTAD